MANKILVRASAQQANVPIFGGENYDFWFVKMKTMFLSFGFWDLVENGFKEQESVDNLTLAQQTELNEKRQDDNAVLGMIQRGVADSIFPKIMRATKAKEAWGILKQEFQEHVKAKEAQMTEISMLEDLEKDIRKESKNEPLLWFSSIYRVPDKIRKLNEDAYTPHVVSIGPFHHGKKEVNFMERQKLRYLPRFLERNSINLSKLVGFVKYFEDEIRVYYSETFDDLCSEKFVRMVTLDSIFILELFFKLYDSNNIEDSNNVEDIFTENRWMLDAVRRDLILLENQLPYFILEVLSENFYKLSKPSFLGLVCEFFKEHTNVVDYYFLSDSPQEFRHFTDVIRSSYKPHPLMQLCPPNRSVNIHNASKLHEAGVKFKKIKLGRNLFDVHAGFSKGVLQMAKIQVEEKTESLLRNLMALEQWLYPSDTYICHYVSLLDNLIDTSNDVELLVKADILSHRLGSSDEVVSLVNKLCINIETSKALPNEDNRSRRLCSRNAVVSSLVNNLCINTETSDKGFYEKLNDYYDKPCHKWKAFFIHEYFNTPFKVASTTTAVIFLVLTFIQTVLAFVKK